MYFQLFDDDDRCVPHFVFRQELLNDSLCLLAKELGLRANFNLSHQRVLRKKAQREYRTFYNSRLVDFMRNNCGRELEAFGYDFGWRDDRMILDPAAIRYNPSIDDFALESQPSVGDRP